MMHARWKLKRIGILSAVKIGGVISCVFGFITGFICAVIVVFFSSVVSMMMSGQPSGPGFTALIFIPVLFTVFFGFLGAFGTFLYVLLYNLAAGLLGGIDLEIDTPYESAPEDEYTGMWSI